ncbi:MAG TPA: arylsulfotransferase family protein [Longimicrobiales bacterium]|nr:arylsulfotransferase family protein [Longimicrobiales bacterium]
MKTGFFLLRAGALLIAAGCTSDGTGLVHEPAPEIAGSAASAGNHNVLSATVSVNVIHAESVAVRYRLTDDAEAQITPAVMPADGSATVPVLGLLPDREYLLEAVAFGSTRVASGSVLPFTTGSLPDDLPSYAVAGDDPTPGFVVMAAGPYGLAIDNAGRVVWYRRFDSGPGLNFQAQPTGRYTALQPAAAPDAPAGWIEVDPLGAAVRVFTCARGLQPRFHDLLSEPDGSYWLLCDETRTMDLSGVGGLPGARVTGTIIQRVGATGALLFEWSVFDHFQIADLHPDELALPSINWTHGNALDLDYDGNLLVSFRNLSEITKIDVRTGAVLWRMGGVRNQFLFHDTPLPPFTRQHSVRATTPGSVLLLDNLGDPAGTQAEWYAYDAAARTTRLIASYRSNASVIAQVGGTAQRLPRGRTLVSFGNGAHVAEYDDSGTEVWRIVNPGYVFRAQRIQSLYAPGVGSAR